MTEIKVGDNWLERAPSPSFQRSPHFISIAGTSPSGPVVGRTDGLGIVLYLLVAVALAPDPIPGGGAQPHLAVFGGTPIPGMVPGGFPLPRGFAVGGCRVHHPLFFQGAGPGGALGVGAGGVLAPRVARKRTAAAAMKRQQQRQHTHTQTHPGGGAIWGGGGEDKTQSTQCEVPGDGMSWGGTTHNPWVQHPPCTPPPPPLPSMLLLGGDTHDCNTTGTDRRTDKRTDRPLPAVTSSGTPPGGGPSSLLV